MPTRGTRFCPLQFALCPSYPSARGLSQYFCEVTAVALNGSRTGIANYRIAADQGNCRIGHDALCNRHDDPVDTLDTAVGADVPKLLAPEAIPRIRQGRIAARTGARCGVEGQVQYHGSTSWALLASEGATAPVVLAAFCLLTWIGAPGAI